MDKDGHDDGLHLILQLLYIHRRRMVSDVAAVEMECARHGVFPEPVIFSRAAVHESG